jgi:hypothetical protein
MYCLIPSLFDCLLTCSYAPLNPCSEGAVSAQVQQRYNDLLLAVDHGCTHFFCAPIITARGSNNAASRRTVGFLTLGFETQQAMSVQ